MKKLISRAVVAAALGAASTAYAADMAYKAPPPAAPVYSWTGFYAGFNAGGIWTNKDDLNFAGTDTGTGGLGTALNRAGFPQQYSTAPSGFIGGFQAGYNWQVGAIVWGVEADFQYSGARQSYAFTSSNPNFATVSLFGDNNTNWFGTVRGRVGWLATPQALIYATGGLYYADRKFSLGAVAPAGAPPLAAFGSDNGTATGWTVGGGLEYAMGGGWSAKFEYLYYDLGDRSATIFYRYGAGNTSSLTASFNDGGQIARFGVNYKFGGDYGKAPVVAKY